LIAQLKKLTFWYCTSHYYVSSCRFRAKTKKRVFFSGSSAVCAKYRFNLHLAQQLILHTKNVAFCTRHLLRHLLVLQLLLTQF